MLEEGKRRDDGYGTKWAISKCRATALVCQLCRFFWSIFGPNRSWTSCEFNTHCPPPTPTRLNCRVESSRHWRCVSGISRVISSKGQCVVCVCWDCDAMSWSLAKRATLVST